MTHFKRAINAGLCFMLVIQYCTLTIVYGATTDLYYWQVEPYTKNDVGGIETKGLYGDVFLEIYKRSGNCLNFTNSNEIINYKHKYNSFGEFNRALREMITGNDRPEFTNHTGFTFWFPVLKPIEQRRNFAIVEVTRTSSLSLVTLQKRVNISKKFFGIYKQVDKFLIIGASLALLFGILFWLLDLNTQSMSSFFLGLSDGLWWSFNAMTSVGYGDVIPRRNSAKILGVIWMLMGMALSATMISFAEQAYKTTQISFNMEDSIIGVLNETQEEEIVKGLPNMAVLEYKSYQDIFKALRDQDIDVGAINSDVTAYAQDYWNEGEGEKKPLTVVKTLKKPLAVYMVVHGDIDEFRRQYVQQCPSDWIDIVKTSEFKHKKQLEITPTYMPSLMFILTRDETTVILLLIAAGMIGLGILFDIVCMIIRYAVQKRQREIAAEHLEEVKEEDCGQTIKVSEKEFRKLQADMAWIQKMIQETLNNQCSNQ